MSDTRPIGVFDSGLGGLTIVKELVKLLPNEDIVYFGDTGRVPYGNRSKNIIRQYAYQDEKFLLSKNVKAIVAACGTVSSVAANSAKDLPVPFIEVVSHSVNAAVRTTKNKKIAVIGTVATINSDAHKKQISALLKNAEIMSVATPLLVPLVEEGWTNKENETVLRTVKDYLTPIIDFGADTLILGCTHYPLLSDVINYVTNGKINLINMGEETAVAVKNILAENNLLTDNSSKGKIDFYLSDKTQTFTSTAYTLLGKKISEDEITLVDVDKL